MSSSPSPALHWFLETIMFMAVSVSQIPSGRHNYHQYDIFKDYFPDKIEGANVFWNLFI